MLRLPNGAARRIFLDRHLLSKMPAGPAKGADLLSLIEQLGFVQIDSINTVARAHDLILFARKPRYRPDDLKRLYERDRALFEHWTHDAAVIPLSFYPQWDLRRRRDAERLRQRWSKERREGFEQRFQTVMDRIRAEGPLSSSDVGEGEPRGSGGWWDWHPSKTALEYLWRSGALHVVGREGFRKRYDLAERALPPHLLEDRAVPDEAEIVLWCCNSALDRLGFATHGELAAFWAHLRPAETRDWAQAACARGEIEIIEIEGADGSAKKSYARPGIDRDPAIQQPPTNRLRVLSPFDPALRDRRRAQHLFGFDYRIEVFVPEAQRRFGYYVFPILQGDSLVGRIDMKAYRDQDTLRIRALWPEGSVRWGKGRVAALEAELERIKRLAGVSEVTFEQGWLRDPAQRFL